jgi:hypothetical protein
MSLAFANTVGLFNQRRFTFIVVVGYALFVGMTLGVAKVKAKFKPL